MFYQVAQRNNVPVIDIRLSQMEPSDLRGIPFRVKELVDQVRSRWRRRALMQGTAVSLLTFLFFAALFLLLYIQTQLPLRALLIGLGVGILITG